MTSALRADVTSPRWPSTSRCEDQSPKETPMSDVSSGAVLTLVVPLSLLVVVIALWALSQRRRLRGRGDS